MRTFRATVPGPWGKVGAEFHEKEPSQRTQHYLGNGTLVEVDTYAGMSGKERAQARAEALGLSTKGTEKQINDRITEFESDPPQAPDSTPGDGTVVPAETLGTI